MVNLHLHLHGVCPPGLIGIHSHAQLPHPLGTWRAAVKGTETVDGPQRYRSLASCSQASQSHHQWLAVLQRWVRLHPVPGLLCWSQVCLSSNHCQLETSSQLSVGRFECHGWNQRILSTLSWLGPFCLPGITFLVGLVEVWIFPGIGVS